MKKLRTILFLLPVVGVWHATAQSWDISGNGMLSGTYCFREVAWVVGDKAGNLQKAISLYGQIQFDGKGNYTISNQPYNDSTASSPTNFSASGTYAISASGYGYISSPAYKGDWVFGLVSNGIFIGSSTENRSGYNDMFVAAQLVSPAPPSALFNGTYNMVDLDFSAIGQGGMAYNRQSTFQLRPNGTGIMGWLQVSGSIAGSGASVISQSILSVPYFTNGGVLNLNFGGKSVNPTSSTLIAGTKYLYTSADGNFLFGGDPQYAWDMILGVRQGSAAPSFNNLYYQAGVYVDNSQLTKSGAELETFYGSLNVSSSGELVHKRVLPVFQTGPYDYTYSDQVTGNADGTYSDSFTKYFFSTTGAVAVGICTGSGFGVAALVQAPTWGGAGPYIFPTGIVNAASSAPFTAALAPGELVSIYGTNLISVTATDATLPATLNGVQVLVNNTAAPIFSMAHTAGYDQINAIIPLSTSSPTATIQVTNNNGSSKSNIVTNFVGSMQPGVFNSYTTTPAVQHGSDYSLVTSSNPARVGETLVVYLTGLGALNSSGNATGPLDVYIDRIQATVLYAGSQSMVGGGYQMNVVVPSGVTTGRNVYLDVAGAGSYNSEVVIPIGASSNVGPPVSVSGSLQNFSGAQGGANPSSQTLTITSSGGPVSWSATSNVAWLTVSPASGTTPAMITVSVNTAGLSQGSYTGTITISAPSGPVSVSVPLQVTSAPTPTAPMAVLSSTLLAFGSQNVGTASPPQIVTLRNTGSGGLAITSIATNNAEFPETNTCPPSLAAGTSCTISVAFAPSVLGTRSGVLTISDNASNSPQTVNLSGAGTSTQESLTFVIPSTLPDGVVGQPYTFSFCTPTPSSLTALCTSPPATNPSGGTPPYHFQLDTAGGFPPLGISLNLNGILAGTPIAAGTVTFRVCAVDLTGASACQTTSITVNNAGGPPGYETWVGTINGTATQKGGCGGVWGFSYDISLTVFGSFVAGIQPGGSGVTGASASASGTETVNVQKSQSACDLLLPSTVSTTDLLMDAFPPMASNPLAQIQLDDPLSPTECTSDPTFGKLCSHFYFTLQPTSISSDVISGTLPSNAGNDELSFTATFTLTKQ